MVIALRIFGVLSLMTAAVTLTCCVIEKRVNRFEGKALAGPSVIGQSGLSGTAVGHDGSDPVSPLLQQAQLFAQYLNPPVPPKEKASPTPPAPEVATIAAEIRPVSATPQFELHGISLHPERPADSMALIWEPGNGRRWVKQGAQLGHCTVTQINGASIIYDNGQQRQEMSLTPTLIAAADVENRTGNPTQSAPASPSSQESRRTQTSHFIARDKTGG